MSIDEILKKDFNEVEVNTFLKYIEIIKNQTKKDGSLTYPWAKYIKDNELITLFKQANNLGLSIDGDSVTLENKGTIKLNFNYQAYKNLVIQKYPEAIFDIQNVFDGDSFDFKKESGKVIYNHKIGNPFDKNKKIVGCYCIIKIRTGEFIEIMNEEEVNKCRAVAKTTSIWDNWKTEMFLKTVIKRACKRHFKDIVKEIDTIDNEDYDLTKSVPNEDMITEEQIQKIDDLGVDKMKACQFMKVNSIIEMTKEQAQKIIDMKTKAK